MRGDLIAFNVDLSCLGWTIYARQFWVPSHRFNSARGEQKEITQTIYTDSEPPSRLPNSLMPSAKLRSANLPFLRLWYDAVGNRTPTSHTPSGRSTHYPTRGRSPVHGTLNRMSYDNPTHPPTLKRVFPKVS